MKKTCLVLLGILCAFLVLNAQVNVSIDWTSQAGEVKREHLGLVVWSGVDPSVSNQQAYQDVFNFADPGLVRFHSNQTTENHYTDGRGWIDTVNREWHSPKIQDALDNFNFSNFETLINIPRAPLYLDRNDDKRPDDATAESEYVNLCGDLVQLLNQNLGYNFTHWTPINELEGAYSSDINNLAQIYNDAITHMKQIDNSVLGGSGEYTQPYDNTLDDFLSATTANTDFISYHQYGTGTSGETDDYYYNRASNVAYGGEYMRGKLDGLGVNSIPLWLTETNIFWTSDADVDKLMRSTKGTVWHALLLKYVAEEGFIDGFTSFNDQDGRYGIMSGSFYKRPTAYLMNLKSRFLEGTVYSASSASPSLIEVLAVEKDANTNAVLIINRSSSAQSVNFSGWGPEEGSAYNVYTIDTDVSVGWDSPYTGYSETSGTVDASFGQNISVGAHSVKLIVAGAGISEPTPSADAININFGTSSNDVPAGYISDPGDVYSSQNGYNYGWDVAQSTKNRNTGDPLRETCVRIGTGSYWEIELANGDYDITVGVGDTWGTNNTINVEGVNVFQDLVLGGGEYADETASVTVSDGKLTLDNGSSADKDTRINYIDITPVEQTYNDSAINVSGPTSVEAGQTYSISVEYAASQDREIAVYLYNTTTWNKYGQSRVSVTQGSGTVNIDVPVTDPQPGSDYQWTAKVEPVGGGNAFDQVSQWCKVVFGDLANDVSGTTSVEARQTYTLEVQYEASQDREIAVYLYNTTTWNKYGQSRVSVTQGSGTVNIDVPVTDPQPGSDYQWTAKVEPVGGGSYFDQVSQWCKVIDNSSSTGSTIKINYGTSHNDIPVGYIGDPGDVYGTQNGYNYGWDVAQSTKNRETGDSLRETCVRIGAGSYWEIDLSNGYYDVTIGIGDTWGTENTINIEGVNVYQNYILNGGEYAESTANVQVQDGKLTLDNGGAGDKDTRVTHIVITEDLLKKGQANISPVSAHEEFLFYVNSTVNELVFKNYIEHAKKVNLYNINGSKVFSKNVNAYENNIQIPFNHGGFYIIHIEMDNKKYIQKILK